MNIAEINCWTDQEACEQFRRCCGSSRWSESMARLRPFGSAAALLAAAEREWWELAQSDWLEAFAAHPRIGDMTALKARYAATASWASAEQAGVAGADDGVLHELAELNDRYQAHFGYIFLVCATGKSAGEMLALLRDRLHNRPDDEIRIAAAEQMKITRIRLEKIAP
jgi:2-oxo-4-hydroxy-4-carboxy-5-ureidoimidazoline decarboxylase